MSSDELALGSSFSERTEEWGSIGGTIGGSIGGSIPCSCPKLAEEACSCGTSDLELAEEPLLTKPAELFS